MSQTMIELWNGNIAPGEHCGAHDTQANKLICLMERNREKLNAGLTEVQKKLLQKYIDCADEYWMHMMELAFCDGFSLASRLTVEALTE